MEKQDKNFSKLYTEIYENTHADQEFKERVRTMTEKKYKKPRTVVKVVCAFAAALVLVMATGIIASASRGEYINITVNGEQKKARYGDFGNNTRLIQYTIGNTTYDTYIHGDFDKDNDKLYLVENDSFYTITTNPDQQLNLYTDIDKSKFAAFKEEDGTKYLMITDDSGTDTRYFNDDAADGKEDGVIMDNGKIFETYVLLPNGAVSNTMKVELDPLTKLIDGHFWDEFWENFGN
ncbi:MAG: hypothetical protein IIT39_10135 [Clostridia bacterium]|nr:hypothetical protein [Clostridia bacterium]